MRGCCSTTPPSSESPVAKHPFVSYAGSVMVDPQPPARRSVISTEGPVGRRNNRAERNRGQHRRATLKSLNGSQCCHQAHRRLARRDRLHQGRPPAAVGALLRARRPLRDGRRCAAAAVTANTPAPPYSPGSSAVAGPPTVPHVVV